MARKPGVPIEKPYGAIAILGHVAVLIAAVISILIRGGYIVVFPDTLAGEGGSGR